MWEGQGEMAQSMPLWSEQEPDSMEGKEFAEGFKGTEFNWPGVWSRFVMRHQSHPFSNLLHTSTLVNRDLGLIPF